MVSDCNQQKLIAVENMDKCGIENSSELHTLSNVIDTTSDFFMMENNTKLRPANRRVYPSKTGVNSNVKTKKSVTENNEQGTSQKDNDLNILHSVKVNYGQDSISENKLLQKQEGNINRNIVNPCKFYQHADFGQLNYSINDDLPINGASDFGQFISSNDKISIDQSISRERTESVIKCNPQSILHHSRSTPGKNMKQNAGVKVPTRVLKTERILKKIDMHDLKKCRKRKKYPNRINEKEMNEKTVADVVAENTTGDDVACSQQTTVNDVNMRVNNEMEITSQPAMTSSEGVVEGTEVRQICPVVSSGKINEKCVMEKAGNMIESQKVDGKKGNVIFDNSSILQKHKCKFDEKARMLDGINGKCDKNQQRNLIINRLDKTSKELSGFSNNLENSITRKVGLKSLKCSEIKDVRDIWTKENENSHQIDTAINIIQCKPTGDGSVKFQQNESNGNTETPENDGTTERQDKDTPQHQDSSDNIDKEESVSEPIEKTNSESNDFKPRKRGRPRSSGCNQKKKDENIEFEGEATQSADAERTAKKRGRPRKVPEENVVNKPIPAPVTPETPDVTTREAGRWIRNRWAPYSESTLYKRKKKESQDTSGRNEDDAPSVELSIESASSVDNALSPLQIKKAIRSLIVKRPIKYKFLRDPPTIDNNQTDDYFSKEMVKCARCEKIMELGEYKRSHRETHYYLCWLEGEEPMDLKDKDFISQRLRLVIPHKSSVKRLVKLTCDICNEKTCNSALGFVSHFVTCGEPLTETPSLKGVRLSRAEDNYNRLISRGSEIKCAILSKVALYTHLTSEGWLPLIDKTIYEPDINISMEIKLNDQLPVKRFQAYESSVNNGAVIMFAAGPVWSLSWVPVPKPVVTQYLTVYAHPNMNIPIPSSGSSIFSSFIQLWEIQTLNNSSVEIENPKLGLKIAHDFGAVWSMEWCPSGGYEESIDRLGLLAAATSSGFITIYSVPLSYRKQSTVKAEPVLLLTLHRNDANVQCTRVAWEKCSPHNTIFGGFSNGVVAMWIVDTKSVLLKERVFLYAYKIFLPHTSPITVLTNSWIDNGRYMTTGSLDGTVKHWDLRDLTSPVHVVDKVNNVLDGCTLQQSLLSVAVYDHVANLDTTAYLTPIRENLDTGDRSKGLLPYRETSWGVSLSDWNDQIAFCSNSGNVYVYLYNPDRSLLTKSPYLQKHLVSVLNLIEKQAKGNKHSGKKINTEMDDGEILNSIKSYENAESKYILQPKNVWMESFTSAEKRMNPEAYQISSANKVSWNQNYSSFQWLAIGYQAGFVRLVKVPFRTKNGSQGI